jgi:CheY-like chemotaxis protein
MKIFAIDDDQLSLFLTQQLLKLEGFENVQTFLWAQDALDVLAKCSHEEIPDIILLDLNMPVMSGWEFLYALASLEPALRGKCSIYILTSSLNVLDTAQSQEYPLVSGLLHKPITAEDIMVIAQQATGFQQQYPKKQ